MPAEKFYQPDRVEGDEPDLTVAWGAGMVAIKYATGGVVQAGGPPMALPDPHVLSWTTRDLSGLNRLIKSLRRAREHLLDHEQ